MLATSADRGMMRQPAGGHQVAQRRSGHEVADEDRQTVNDRDLVNGHDSRMPKLSGRPRLAEEPRDCPRRFRSDVRAEPSGRRSGSTERPSARQTVPNPPTPTRSRSWNLPSCRAGSSSRVEPFEARLRSTVIRGSRLASRRRLSRLAYSGPAGIGESCASSHCSSSSGNRCW